MSKVSKAQLKVLELMARGRFLGLNDSWSFTIGRLPVQRSTVDTLKDKGLIKADEEFLETYRITPEGRAVVQAADTAGEEG